MNTRRFLKARKSDGCSMLVHVALVVALAIDDILPLYTACRGISSRNRDCVYLLDGAVSPMQSLGSSSRQ
jgi:hypothetical protein